LVALLITLSITGVCLSPGTKAQLPFTQVLEPGYAVHPYAVGAAAPVAIAFGPDGALYVASYAGTIQRFRDIGGAAGPPELVVTGLRTPEGLAWGPDGKLYVASVDPDNMTDGRTWGMISRYDPWAAQLPLDAGVSGQKLLVDIPNGIHTVSGVTFGPDGLLYVSNGSSSENGDNDPAQPGVPEVPPLTMAIFRFDVAAAADHPLRALHYLGSGEPVEDPVDIVATGIHEPFHVVFRGRDAYAASNAPQGQEPLGEDQVVRVPDAPAASLAAGTAYNFGSPGCLYTHDERGWPVAGASSYPNLPPEQRTCEGVTPVAAVLGLHPGATGLAFASGGFGRFDGDLFVTDMGSLFSVVPQGHKIVRIGIAPDGSVRSVAGGAPDIADFMAGVEPVDVIFRDGAMYVADFAAGAVLRVTTA
jgi:glucose/arabinose dehydrogenase